MEKQRKERWCGELENEWMNGETEKRKMIRLTRKWMNEWMNGWMNEWMNEWMAKQRKERWCGELENEWINGKTEKKKMMRLTRKWNGKIRPNTILQIERENTDV